MERGRVLFVAGVLLALPILALPAVQQRLRSWRWPLSQAAGPETLAWEPEGEAALRKEPDRARPPAVWDPLSPEVTAIREGLQEAGASYMKLQQLQGDPPRFHFHCQIPLADNPMYRRSYSSTATAPLVALRDVLTQVRSARVRVGRVPPLTADRVLVYPVHTEPVHTEPVPDPMPNDPVLNDPVLNDPAAGEVPCGDQ